MDPRLLEHYNRELAHLREMGAEFAREYPKIAARLGMEGLEVADPYVERLMEAFAFVAARVQLKIDAEFPRFTQHLLELVYPHYLTPTPSFMVVELLPKFDDPALADGARVERGTAMRSVVPRGEQTACEFRTAHALRVWPLAVGAARCFGYAADLPLGALGVAAQARGGVRIRLDAQGGVPLSGIACDELTFFVAGAEAVSGPLHELVSSQCVEVLAVAPGAPPRVLARLGAAAVQAVGFDDDEALMPYDRRSFQGYRLLREYFAFPQRFRFFKVTGLRKAFAQCAGGELELVLLFARHEAALEEAVDASTLVLNATPIVNLFPRRADRIHLAEGEFEHHLQVDRTRPMDFEVFSVRSVRGIGEVADDAVDFAPFYGDLVHHDAPASGSYYTLRREPRMFSERQRRQGSRTGYIGSEVFVSLVDPREAPFPRDMRQLAVEVMATNRDLPLLLPIGALNTLTPDASVQLDGVRVLAGPTRPRPGVAEGDFAWRLISQLSLNYLSLLDDAQPGGSARALRELLLLYSDVAEPANRKQCESVIALSAQPVVRRLPTTGPIVFGRGLAIDLTLNENAFGGAGGYLLGAVLERFFARHVSINSFTQMRLVSESRGEVARWPARTGSRSVG